MEQKSCNGSCGTCGGCARELVLTQQEAAFLEKLGQIPFLPVARNMGDLTPVYLEEGDCSSSIRQKIRSSSLISS